jgi:hypothetical protein
VIDDAIKNIINQSRKSIEDLIDGSEIRTHAVSDFDRQLLKLISSLLLVTEAVFAKVRVLDGFVLNE